MMLSQYVLSRSFTYQPNRKRRLARLVPLCLGILAFLNINCSDSDSDAESETATEAEKETEKERDTETETEAEKETSVECHYEASTTGLGRQTAICEFDVSGDPDTVFQLLEPIEQPRWLNKPSSKYYCPANVSSENDCVFNALADDEPETWFTTYRDTENHFIQYLNFRSSLYVERQDITVSSIGSKESRVRWTRTVTAVSEDGQNSLADMTEETLTAHAEKTVSALGFYLANGEPLEDNLGTATKSDFESSRVDLEVTHHIEFPPEDVFPLLCPVLEYEWLDGWACTMIYSETGIAEDNCVFTTEEYGMMGTWAITRFEPEAGRIIYHLLYPEGGIMRVVDAEVTEAENDTSDLTWRVSVVGLSKNGNLFIDTNLTSEFLEAEMAYSEKAINYYLETGKMLKRPSLSL